MSNYKISLQPLGPFFFGGENTFGDDNANYFVQSNCLPQQTGLLGFLRHELLVQNELLNKFDEAKWTALIGNASFDGIERKFGVIEKLSPLFLSNGAQHYLPQAMDWALDENKKLQPLLVRLSHDGEAYTDSYRKSVPVAEAGNKYYDAKHGLKALWVAAFGGSLHQWEYDKDYPEDPQHKNHKGYENGFFVKHQQVGIHRKTTRTDKETGDFYTQVFYRLQKEMAFTFFAELKEGTVLNSRVVTMGGERSAFYMTVQSTHENFEGIFTQATFTTGHSRTMKALVLTSDAYTSPAILQQADFAITGTLPFRNIRTTQEANGNYASIRGSSGSKAPMEKNNSLSYLLQRGSVFYYSTDAQLTALEKALKNTAYETIGYNHYIKLNP